MDSLNRRIGLYSNHNEIPVLRIMYISFKVTDKTFINWSTHLMKTWKAVFTTYQLVTKKGSKCCLLRLKELQRYLGWWGNQQNTILTPQWGTLKNISKRNLNFLVFFTTYEKWKDINFTSNVPNENFSSVFSKEKYIENNEYMDNVSLDFSKAFDKVSHGNWVQKIKARCAD